VAHLAEGKLLKDRPKRKSGNNSNDDDDDDDGGGGGGDRDKSRYLPFTRTVLLVLVLLLSADNLEPNLNNFRKTP
jgi:hypothetical protein